MSADWWGAAPHPELSQGDIVRDLPLGASTYPRVFLSPSELKGDRIWCPCQSWQADRDGLGHFLARGRFIAALVLSHSCELDKKERRGRVQVAPVASIGGIDEKNRQAIMAQRRISLMPLPGVPQLGDCYADLRIMSSIDRRLIAEAERVAGMTEGGVQRLQAQLVAFFTRKDLDAAVA